MNELRLGDIIDDHCIKCRRLTNHAIVSLLDGQVAKVRCRSCYHEHNYLHEQAPPSKKDLKKAELFNAVLANTAPTPPADDAAPETVTETEAEKPAADTPPAKKTRGRAKKA